MKVCGVGHVRVYCFPVWLFHRLLNLTSQVPHDNELYFCDRQGSYPLWVKVLPQPPSQPFWKLVVST